MKHASNRKLFDHWSLRRGPRLAPRRADIEPGAIRHALADTFMLEACGPGYVFRLAGTRVCALFGRELKGEDFTGLWRHLHRTALTELLAVVTEETLGVVASATGATATDVRLPVRLELLLLPLAHRDEAEARILGSLAPLTEPYWLFAKPVGALELGMFRHVGGWEDRIPPPRFRAAPGRMRHGLIVHDGGLAE